MDKDSAIHAWNSRSPSARMHRSSTHFANVNARKPVWWLDIPIVEIFDVTEPAINLLLAESDGNLHHLRVMKAWLIDHIGQLARRQDKDVISLELSTLAGNRFQDVRPTSGRLRFDEFVIKRIARPA